MKRFTIFFAEVLNSVVVGAPITIRAQGAQLMRIYFEIRMDEFLRL